MSVQINKGKALEALNLTPLIDVVFLLLIFFLVATQFAQDDQQLPIRLPSASSAVPMTMEPEELVIQISQEGDTYIAGIRLDPRELEQRVAQAIVDNPLRQTVILRGDRRTEFQSIVNVIDLLTKLKVPSYRITVDETDSASGKSPPGPLEPRR